MAALGRIRRAGALLVTVIGLALFAFIAEELFRSCEATAGEKRQQVGEVLGKKVSVQEFQDLMEEYEAWLKVAQNRENLSEDEVNRVKDQVWGNFVNSTLLSAETDKLGLTVTDEELQNVLREGTHQMLRQSPFVNQQTGRFEVAALTKFLDDYKQISSGTTQVNSQVLENYQTIYDYWRYMEKMLRQQILIGKYQALLSGCILSNPISARMAFDDDNVESSVELASVSYITINDNEVEVTDKELKERYEAMKNGFRQLEESRDIKYVSFQVTASAEDRTSLSKTLQAAADSLKAGGDPATIVRKAQSEQAWLGLPRTLKSFPKDIRTRLDSMVIGEVTEVFETKSDNTLNVIKLISKTTLPDSVQFRQIGVGGTSLEDARQRADSIYNALSGGASFEDVAGLYMQDGASQWVTSSQYESSQQMDDDSRLYLESINGMKAGEIRNIEMSQGNIVIQVLDRRSMVDKYVAAVIKHTIDFSKETYSKAYNEFSQFVSESSTLEELEQNATKHGYKLMDRGDIYNSEHKVANVRATRDAMKWIFDAKESQISPLYECGNNDHLLVVALTKIHKKGYRDLESVANEVKAEILRDKKFALISAKLEGATTIEEAKKKGAVVSQVDQVTFSAPVSVRTTGGSEPALSGAVAATDEGKTCPRIIKGNAAAYMVKVGKKMVREGARYDEAAMEEELTQQALQAASRFVNELYMEGDVTDNRYLFF